MTSFHHQPEAQHPKSSAIHKLPADYPIFTPDNCRDCHPPARLLRARSAVHEWRRICKIFAMDLSSVSLSSQRLLLRSFTSDDAREAFLAATPTIARFMSWEPAPSLEAFERIWQSWIPQMRAGTDVSLTVRDTPSLKFLGIAALHNTDAVEPEVGIWIKELQHGYGYGREAIATIVAFAADDLGKRAVVYPVVEQNGPSRRLAESLGGRIVGSRLLRKADGIEHPEVVYRIPASALN